MKLTLYQIDAFSNRLFSGNPAAVIPLDKWIDEELMQKLGMENNLSDTGFFVPSKKNGADYEIRWFTPALEIDLCGHATLASAYVLYNILGFSKPELKFDCKSGVLVITRDKEKIRMNFPAWKPSAFPDYPTELKTALGNPEILNVYRSRDVLIELESEDAVRSCNPDFTLLKKIGEKVIITAKGDKADFVSRFFAPIAGIDEDPVTGSAHSQLIPYWAEKLGKTKMHALQLSPRGGEIWCEFLGDRVIMAGECVCYMKGELTI
jgi:PhzF family phenazine biosynthesis protein